MKGIGWLYFLGSTLEELYRVAKRDTAATHQLIRVLFEEGVQVETTEF